MPPVAETSIVNATAPSPNIRLRITDKNGKDITGARLGDELFLRIEMDDDEVFGIFARELIAKSGSNQNESIMLIDSDGCPTDPNIFPVLERIPNSKGLIVSFFLIYKDLTYERFIYCFSFKIQGKFDAFKFADDVVVRFQVNVQFCLQECLPVNCDHSRHVDSELLKNVQSWGRKRRRRRSITIDDKKYLSNKTELHREIIVESVSRLNGNHERLQDEKLEKQLQMYCATKTTMIIGIITLFMLQVC